MGEKENQPFQLSFNASLRVDFQASRVTSDGSLILVRELDERLGLSELVQQHLTDPRGKNTQLPLAEPSDAAALWSDAAKDRATIPLCGTSGIGEPQTGSDFGDEGGRGRKSV